MSRQAPPADRGLQPERTVLAWTRTSLAIVVSGALVLVKDREATHLGEHPVRCAVGVAVSAIAVGVFAVGVRRRWILQRRPLPARISARREVICAGRSIMALTVLVVAYLLLPML